MNPLTRCLLLTMCMMSCSSTLSAQIECTGWGDLRGMRVKGQLMQFTTGLRITRADGSESVQSHNQGVRNPRYTRSGNKQTVSATLAFRDGQGLAYTQVVQDNADNSATLDLEATATADLDLAGIYYVISFSSSEYSNGTAYLVEPASGTESPFSLAATQPSGPNEYLRGRGKGLKLVSPGHEFQVTFPSEMEVVVRDDRSRGNGNINAYITLATGNLVSGKSVKTSLAFKVIGEVDLTPVSIAIDTAHPGRAFDGIGGNFRLQNPTADPPIIRYNLDNLRVAWGRVAMPLNLWQPNENTDPLDPANAAQLNQNVRQAMEMAKTLGDKKIPLIASAWQAPNWALGPAPARGRAGQQSNGLRGRPILPEKLEALAKSIGSYLVYLKQYYAVEVELYSFNESDLGIDVRQTPEEHAQMIKTFGAHFASRGLKTKLLLGDTSDATPTHFIDIAMNDPQAVKYIGAVSFHSWRGATDEQLMSWTRAAQNLNIPLLVGEGGTDADAYRYPAIYEEPWFAQYEIDLYVRICRLCQPLSILHWQLTSDYSVLKGGRNEPLAPTMRFWQLKQLGNTPVGLASIPITCDRPEISYAAFGDAAGKSVVIHLVNTAASRDATITGLPAGMKELRVIVTDRNRGMKELSRVTVSNGSAQVPLDTQSFTTLIGE